MIFEFIPVAEASVETLMKSINKVIINPIIFFLFALAMVYFLYGVAQYLLNPESEEIRKKSKTHMLYGIFGLFIMVAVFGIMNLILNTLKERRIKIDGTGDYQIVNNGKNYNLDSENESKLDSYIPEQVDITNENINLTKFDQSPFPVEYEENKLCWRKEIHTTGYLKDVSIQRAKDEARSAYLHDNSFSSSEVSFNLPLDFGTLTSYDNVNKIYHTWRDARAPKKGGSINDCVLRASSTTELSLGDYVSGEPFSEPQYMSNGPSPFTNLYISDNLFVRIIASGVNSLLQLARDIAIKNAFALIGLEIKDINTMTIVYPTARILEEKYIFNKQTGKYEYWVAVESAKVSNPVSDITKDSPFTKNYTSDFLLERLVNYATSKNAITARELAIKNALTDLSKRVDPNDVSTGVQLMIILEEKQIFNEKIGEYEYWVAIEGSKTTDGSNPAGESSKVAPFTKLYKTDNSTYRVVASGVDKDLLSAKSIAINNGLIKLKKEIGDSSNRAKEVKIIEEKNTFNSLTGNYEYWVALEVSKN